MTTKKGFFLLTLKILSLIFAGNVLKWKLVMFRVWLNRLWFGIHNRISNFHDWALCHNELFHNSRRKRKSMDLSMDLWHSNNMKVILPNFAKDHCFWTLWKLNKWPWLCSLYSFFCIDYFQILFSNFQKTWLNLPLCGRNPIKSVLFFCPSLSVCDAFSSGSTLWIFIIFCMRIFCHIY